MRVLRGTTILTYAATKNSLDPAAADLTIAAGMFDTDETLTAEVAATFPPAGSSEPTSTSPSRSENCDVPPPLTELGKANLGAAKPNDQR